MNVANADSAPDGDNASTDTPAGSADRRAGGNAASAVIHHVETLIFGGEMEPGDSLPSESELAATLGVSRLTVREAIRALQARGLVDVSHGRRAIVAHPNALPLQDFFSASVRRDARGIMELLEVRLAIEVHAAQLAATHATRSDMDALEMALERMRRTVDDEEAFNEADIRFHAAVASASGNRMLSFLVEGMELPLHHGRHSSIRGFRARSESLETLVETHQEIFAAIASRDARQAASLMRKHLVQTRNDLRAGLAGQR